MQELDEKLKNYNELLLQHYELYKLPQPHYDEVSNLSRFIHDKTAHGDHGEGFSFMHYPENVVWETLDKKLVQKDLVSLSGHEEPAGPDAFTKLIRWSVLKRFHRLFG
ncbi:MAG: hypothetical protein MMC33_008225 [Icmadophila ericetorum]|nr:hypothetical protein [Icmadophila ericetorum]